MWSGLFGLVSCGPGGDLLGGEVSNLDLGLQRTPCCRYTTPDLTRDPSGRRRPQLAEVTRGSDVTRRAVRTTVTDAMGSLIKKRRKRMRKKKHKKLLKKTRWQRRTQGK